MHGEMEAGQQALGALLSCFAESGIAGSVAKERWEYMVWERPHMPRGLEDRVPRLTQTLNRYGSEGWELVSVLWEPFRPGDDPPGKLLYHFRRKCHGG